MIHAKGFHAREFRFLVKAYSYRDLPPGLATWRASEEACHLAKLFMYNWLKTLYTHLQETMKTKWLRLTAEKEIENSVCERVSNRGSLLARDGGVEFREHRGPALFLKSYFKDLSMWGAGYMQQ